MYIFKILSPRTLYFRLNISIIHVEEKQKKDEITRHIYNIQNTKENVRGKVSQTITNENK